MLDCFIVLYLCRSKIQTFTPTIFTMSNQQQQTAEKSVQTHDSSGSTTAVLFDK